MSVHTWSPDDYLRFADERTRPARDLLAQVGTAEPGRVVDVGCGPGNSTELLAARWPGADILGFDTSEEMLAEARRRLPGVRFETHDAASWLPGPGTGVVFANAVYQWIPSHLQHFARILEHLESGATLAVQMPDNLMQPMHVLMREVAALPPFRDTLAGVARPPLPPPGAYYDALAGRARRLDIWHSVYNHVMDDAAAIVTWVKATGLAPFLAPLEGPEREAFLDAYGARIAAAYPPAADGKVLLGFSRLFIIAER